MNGELFLLVRILPEVSRFGQLLDGAGTDGNTSIGTRHRRKAQFETAEIVPRRMAWLPLFGDRTEPCPHRPLEAVFEPAALQLDRRRALFGMEVHDLFVEARADRPQRS